jgi:6-pyruvoyltetrahydropterin/6-carboxytetrahydropterin synthase
MAHRITLERNTLRFSAAHFTTFQGECEPLHGHNYDVLVEIEGGLTEDSWVFNFTVAKRLVAAICKELDHRFLLPSKSTAVAIEERDTEYEISFADRRYVFPRSDVAVLPIANSTAELLAEWIANRIADEFRSRNASNVERVTVGVEEAPGQAGWFSRSLP